MSDSFERTTDRTPPYDEEDGALERQGPVVRDKRRIDPETGEVRHTASAPSAESEPQGPDAAFGSDSGGGSGLEGAAAELAAERLADLQRLQAEYVNYRKRVERDRDVARDLAVGSVLESLLPVLDDIHLARQHGDLEGGPFAAIADKLESTLGKYGLVRFGAKGEVFDPMQHEALMHAPWPADDELPTDATATTVVTVLQPGYRAGEQVLRPARVAVADPE